MNHYFPMHCLNFCHPFWMLSFFYNIFVIFGILSIFWLSVLPFHVMYNINYLNIKGRISQKFFCTQYNPCSEKGRMVKSAHGWELPNILKFRTQNGTSFNFTGLILKWAGMNLKYLQLPFTIFNFRSYVEQPSLFMTKLKRGN